MLRSAMIAILCLAGTILVRAQAPKAPTIEVFGGFSYLNAAGYEGRRHFGNVATGVTININKHFGIAADVGLPVAGPSEQFRSLTVGFPFQPPEVLSYRDTTRTDTALFGPRFFLRREKMTLFAHGLAGVVRTSFRSEGRLRSVNGGLLASEHFSYSDSVDHFAIGFGGGVDVNLNRRFAIRIVQADYLRTRIDVTGNQLRLQSGVVIRFGQGSH